MNEKQIRCYRYAPNPGRKPRMRSSSSVETEQAECFAMDDLQTMVKDYVAVLEILNRISARKAAEKTIVDTEQ